MPWFNVTGMAKWWYGSGTVMFRSVMSYVFYMDKNQRSKRHLVPVSTSAVLLPSILSPITFLHLVHVW